MSFDKAHALIIGVGQYQLMSAHNVPVAATDAEAVAVALQDQDLCAYPPEQVQLLRNQETTRAAVLSTLAEMGKQLTEDNTLFLFFVGHGVMGTDGNYYLTTHDTKLDHLKVVPGTGISEEDFLKALKGIKAKRLLVVINACHSGNLSPQSLGAEAEALGSQPPPEKLTTAVLGTGEGRIVITACRPEQISWIGNGKLSIFTDALVRGLKGGAPNRNGYISAYSLYEYIFEEAKEAAETFGQTQEAELTVIKGVGPFPVALYKGATSLGVFDESEPIPDGARQVGKEKSERYLRQYNATMIGNGAIAQGKGSKAVGAGSIMVGSNVTGNITTGDKSQD